MFDQFWRTYPARHGRKVGKALCLKVFAMLPHEDQLLVLKAAKHYAEASRPKGTEFVPAPRDPIRFLKADWWRDWIDRPPAVCRFRCLPACENPCEPEQEVCTFHRAYREKIAQLQLRRQA